MSSRVARFPDAPRLIDETAGCAYCPNLCLHACPVATAEGSTAASPWGLMSLVRALANGEVVPSRDVAASLLACTGCGACTDACVNEQPVAPVLRAAREALFGLAGAALELPEPAIEASDDQLLPIGVSGAAILALGDTARFRRSAEAAARRWASRSELVFESAEDLDCVLEAFPRVGVRVERPARLARAGEGGPKAKVEPGAVVAWFEPCTVSRSTHFDRQALRAGAEAALGVPLVSLRWQGKAATCCGAGGAYSAHSPEGAKAAAGRILDEALRVGASVLLTACGGCAQHLEASREGRRIEVRRG